MSTPSTTALPPMARLFTRILEHLKRNNLFYLLSACLMLLGCYLVCVPYLVTLKRESGGLLVLLGTINLYEALVVFACGFICRNAPGNREGSTLLLIALFFLLDVTFTINACLPIDVGFGIGVAAASFVLALFKIYALELGARFPVFGGLKLFLIPALLFLYSFQGILALYPQELVSLSSGAACAVWVVFGALPLLLMGRPQWLEASASDYSNPLGCPWWQSERFKRTAAILTLALVGIQVIGQSWVHRAPFNPSFLVPFLISLLAAAPRLFPQRDHALWLTVRVVLTGFLLLTAAYGTSLQWNFIVDHQTLTITPFRIDCLCAFVAFGLIRLRERRAAYLDWGFGFLVLCGMGADAAAIRRFWEAPPLENTFACLVIGLAWLLSGMMFARAAAYWSLGLLFALRALALDGLIANWNLEYLRWCALGLLGLWLVFAKGPQAVRQGLLALVCGLGVWSCVPDVFSGLLYFYAVAALLAAACVIHWRFYGSVLLGYLAAANLSAFGAPLPASTASWGWIAILCAFAIFGVAFHITRAQLAAAKNSASPPERP